MDSKKKTRLRQQAFELFDRGVSPGEAWKKLGCSRGHTYTLHSDWEVNRERQRAEVEQRERSSVFSRALSENAWRLTEAQWLVAFALVCQLERWMFTGSEDDLTAPPYLAAEAGWREANPDREPEFERGFPQQFRAHSPDTTAYRLSDFSDGDDGVHRERFFQVADAVASGGSSPLQLEAPRALRALVQALWPAEFGTISEELRDDVPWLLNGVIDKIVL